MLYLMIHAPVSPLRGTEGVVESPRSEAHHRSSLIIARKGLILEPGKPSSLFVALKALFVALKALMHAQKDAHHRLRPADEVSG